MARLVEVYSVKTVVDLDEVLYFKKEDDGLVYVVFRSGKVLTIPDVGYDELASLIKKD